MNSPHHKNFYRHPFAMLRRIIAVIACAGAMAARGDSAVGKIIFNNLCFSCHGVSGEGNLLIKSPSIAGLPAWYVTAQLENFRHDRRGFDPQDIEGQLMRAAAKTLDDKGIIAVADYVAQLKRVLPVQTIAASTTAGELLFNERCMECHRFNAEGEIVFGSAPLVGLQDWYLKSQLIKFKNGRRGVLKEDPNGQKMAFASSYIEDEDTLISVIAYLMTLQNEAAIAEKEKKLKALKDPFEAEAVSAQK